MTKLWLIWLEKGNISKNLNCIDLFADSYAIRIWFDFILSVNLRKYLKVLSW